VRTGDQLEFAAIPLIVAGVVVFGLLFLAAAVGGWAWWLLLLAGAVLVVAAARRVARRRRHPPVDGVGDVRAGELRSASADEPYRVLVIADDSCTSAAFGETLVDHAAGRATEALIVAPALGSRVARWTGDEAAYEDAKTHLDATLAALAGMGVEARGHVGSHDPIQAADEGLREFPADEIVFATRAGADVNWLEDGIVETAQSRYDVPVTHLAVDASG
jgi:hypothetical protein